MVPLLKTNPTIYFMLTSGLAGLDYHLAWPSGIAMIISSQHIRGTRAQVCPVYRSKFVTFRILVICTIALGFSFAACKSIQKTTYWLDTTNNERIVCHSGANHLSIARTGCRPGDVEDVPCNGTFIMTWDIKMSTRWHGSRAFFT